MADRDGWILLIKSLRDEHGWTIIDAERTALADPTWRRWVERQINNDAKCRRMALSHIRHHGDASLIDRHEETLIVR